MTAKKHDAETMTLLGIQKKRGRPNTGKAQPAASRKCDQRARDIATITDKPSSEWPERACLMVLSAPEKNPLAQHALKAWHQIGRLRGFKLP